MSKNKIIPQKALVTYNEELGQNTTDSYRLAKKFQMRTQHGREIVKTVFESYLTLKSHYRNFGSEISLSKTEENNIETFDITKHIIPTKLKTDRGVIIDGYYLSEMGYTLVLQQISTPKLEKTKFIADLAKLEFSQAFFLMRDIIQNQPEPLPTHKTVNDSNFGELSKTGNGLARTEEVRGSHRSDKHSDLSVLLGARKRLQNRLSGLFDIELLEDIAKVDKQIEPLQKTILQERLTRNVLDKKLIGDN